MMTKKESNGCDGNPIINFKKMKDRCSKSING